MTLRLRHRVDRVLPLARPLFCAACLLLAMGLGGCVTAHRSDHDASQGRDGVDVSAFDAVDALFGTQR